MCGIAGIIQRPSDAPVTPADTPIAMQQMVSLLQHRGPNETKVVGFRDREVDVWLGATRLAILDLSSGGRQPMIDRSTGCAIAFNGEIYNFRALRRDLESCGVRVQSTGDTEVLLRAYIHWGASFVRRLRGMFAFAVYDPRVPQLMLGRDHFGIKPLDYAIARSSRFGRLSELRFG
jgi:asparagine synthase (glutamine-hydrolysing)